MPGGLPTSSTRGQGQNPEGHPVGVRGPREWIDSQFVLWRDATSTYQCRWLLILR